MLPEASGKELWHAGHGKKEKLRRVLCQVKSCIGSLQVDSTEEL